MLDRDAPESSNENSLIVNNVTDTRSEQSVAQVQPFRSNSLLELASFYAKENVHPHPPMRTRRSSPIRA